MGVNRELGEVKKNNDINTLRDMINCIAFGEIHFFYVNVELGPTQRNN